MIIAFICSELLIVQLFKGGVEIRYLIHKHVSACSQGPIDFTKFQPFNLLKDTTANFTVQLLIWWPWSMFSCNLSAQSSYHDKSCLGCGEVLGHLFKSSFREGTNNSDWNKYICPTIDLCHFYTRYHAPLLWLHGIAEFHCKEDWVSYCERLEHYFGTNDVNEAGKWAIYPLSVCGATTHQFIRNLVALAKRADKSFRELVTLVKEHHTPPPSVTVQSHSLWQSCEGCQNTAEFNTRWMTCCAIA